MLWTGWPLKWKTLDSNALGYDNSVDCIIVFTNKTHLDPAQVLVHPEMDKALQAMIERGAYEGKLGESVMLPTLGLIPQPYVMYVGFDSTRSVPNALRAAAGSAGKKLLEYQIKQVIIKYPVELTSEKCTTRIVAASLMEGLILGLYRRNSFSSMGRPAHKLDEVIFAVGTDVVIEDWNKGLDQGCEFANAVCYARELTNTPANQLTPKDLGEEAKRMAEHYGLEYYIYDEEEAAIAGMGGLLAVGRGSVNPPRMIVIHHRGQPESQQVLGLIGKGITFDTGGISLKKAAGMEEMISDMGGAAAIMGVMRAVGGSKPAINIVAVIPAAENMPSGNAYKPGDVIRTYSGKTVEILNTDAEGRIVLADGMTTALRQGATKLIDIATLTGAVMHALGDVTTGALTNEQSFMEDYLQAAKRAGEYVWPLPTYPEYRALLKSAVADLKNHGGAWAGAIAGGLFVGEFAEGHPWIHLDIGGTAWMWEDRGFESKGGTGVMVRTLLEYINTASIH